MGSTRNLRVGDTHRNWTIIACVSSTATNPAYYTYACKCTCGAERVLLAHSLVHGTSTQCPKCSRGTGKRSRVELHVAIGDVFGQWTVVGDVFANRYGRGSRRICPCVCACGTKRDVDLASLVYGNSTRCAKCAYGSRPTLPGRKTSAGDRNPAYTTWKNIKTRCYSEKSPDYKDYGGRGIRMHDAWRESFDAFYAYVGDRPSKGHSLDRIDNDKGYEPGNVRWATTFEQGNNKRNNNRITAFGKTQSISAWSTEVGMSYSTIKGRLDSGWSPEDALALTPDYLTSQTTIVVGQARKDCLLRELDRLRSRMTVVEQELAKYRDDA